MAESCLQSILPSSVLAYDNIDLIPNGYIPQVGTTARPRTRNQGGQIISERETIRLLPADRLYAEFWFGVSSRITGTNLGDLGRGAFEALGFLGGGAGANIGGAIACSLAGDSERTKARWVFHVCESETRLNREFILTEEQVSSGIIELPDYVMGILGITKEPIEFVTPTTPLTEEQMERARATPADEVEQRLGRRVAPSQLTDSDMRLLLGIFDLNELENLGNSQRIIRGWPQDASGQIKAEFTNYKYSDKENLFVEVVRDERKNRYRADNEFERADGHCFWNGATDDLTDKKVRFNLREQVAEGEVASENLKAGDKVYISYAAAMNPIFRHATENITNFFLFPDQSAYQLPPLDLVKGWNFRKFKFKVRINPEQRSSLADIRNDEDVLKQINEVQNNTELSNTERANQIARLRRQILLTDIECQRLIESKLEKANRNPFIMGCYFADSRGILSLDFRANSQPVLLVPRSAIRDQEWFDALLEELQQSSGRAYDADGQLIVSEANDTLFDDFWFDISDHVNCVLYDNEKFGYEKRLANAISKCTVFNKDIENTGVGFSNLDFIKNQTPGRSEYDLTSAKFSTVPMQGSASLFACNITFTYDFGFCTKGTIQADMTLRTPTFLEKISSKGRIYIEKFQAQNPLRPDGGVFVGTKSFSGENYSVTTDPKNYFGCLVYPDATNGTTNYRIFEDGILNSEFENLSRSDPDSTGHTLPALDDSTTENSVKYGGYDKILGDQPGYFKGTEITTENALVLMNKVPTTIVKTDKLQFTQDENTGRVNVTGIPNRRLRKITIQYIPTSEAFLQNNERFISFVFSGSKTIIDNIAVPYQGEYVALPRIICLDTRYVNLENWFIDGDVLKDMQIVYVEAESIEETEYQKYKISTSILSTCFDASGNWLVFYEDEKGGEGDTTVNGVSADGSHLTGPFDDGAMPGLQEKSDKEISCLLSPDKGGTWYDYKGIVRTVVGETVSSPYAVADKFSNRVDLFFVLNDTLMHKVIDCSMFEYADAFLAYKRPNLLNEKTLPNYGLYHFSESGISIRTSPNNIVVGNVSSDYLKLQFATNVAIRKAGRDDYRILLSGDEKNYEDGFPEVDYFVYRDRTGQLKVMFVANGRFYCRGSSDGGSSWFDFIDGGMLIHKNSNLQELKSASILGVVLDYNSDVSYMTYQVEGMLFMRKFDSETSIVTAKNVVDVMNPDTGISKPVFVLGAITPELKTALQNKETPVIFPYKDIDAFGEGFSISEVASLGYSTASGFLRFFYKDASGNFRAFSYPESPILDINYGNPN